MASPRPSLIGWLLPALACAGCGAQPRGNSDASRVQVIAVDPVTLVLEVPDGPAARRGAGASAALLSIPADTPRGRRHGEYEFNEDPLAAGASMQPGFRNEPPPRCAPWSTCEVRSVLDLHKELFRVCLPGPGATAPRAALRFIARALINQDGVVREANVDGIDPPVAGAAACVEAALQQIPFPLETYDVSTHLKVPVQIVTSSR